MSDRTGMHPLVGALLVILSAYIGIVSWSDRHELTQWQAIVLSILVPVSVALGLGTLIGEVRRWTRHDID